SGGSTISFAGGWGCSGGATAAGPLTSAALRPCNGAAIAPAKDVSANTGSRKYRRIICVSPHQFIMARDTEDHFYVSGLFACAGVLYRFVSVALGIQCDTVCLPGANTL